MAVHPLSKIERGRGASHVRPPEGKWTGAMLRDDAGLVLPPGGPGLAGWLLVDNATGINATLPSSVQTTIDELRGVGLGTNSDDQCWQKIADALNDAGEPVPRRHR